MRPFPGALGALLLCGLMGAGCGKKGPPLAPIIRIPAGVDRVTARRVGDEAYVTFTVPTQNVDASKPADVRRVEVYGATATTPPPRARFLEIAELVGTVEVAPPPLAQDGAKPSSETATGAAAKGAGAVAQGGIVTVRDSLSPEDLVPRELAPLPTASGRRNVVTAPVERRGEPRRFYLAVAYSARGRTSLSATLAEFRLDPLPEAPLEVEVRYTSTSIALSWEPSGGLLGFLLNRALPFELPPIDELAPFRGSLQSSPLSQSSTPAGAVPGSLPNNASPGSPGGAPPGQSVPVPGAGTQEPITSAPDVPETTRYNIYRELEPDPLLLTSPSDGTAVNQVGPPEPINPAPLDALAFTDDLEFERVRCYVIRAVRGTGTTYVEGRGSERRCMKPVDVFPPAAPVGLSAVTASGAISLIWEANTEDDVAGYLILRGGTADATLLPLTNVPIAETQFVDRNVTPGERYAYAVIAVDDRVPVPNLSEESMRVEETAR